MEYIEIFLGILGLGLTIIFCTACCRACIRIRDHQIDMEVRRRNELDGTPRPIYFIPFPRNQQDSDDQMRAPRYSQEVHTPPPFSTPGFNIPPPAYNELEFKPDDPPPAYNEYSSPVYPIAPPPEINTNQPQTLPQQDSSTVPVQAATSLGP